MSEEKARLQTYLGKLSVRGILIFIVRLARRLQPRYALAARDPESIRSIERAITEIDDAAHSRVQGFGWNSHLVFESDWEPLGVPPIAGDKHATNFAEGLNAMCDPLHYAAKDLEIANVAVPEVAADPILRLLSADPDGATTASNKADIDRLVQLTTPTEFGDVINTSTEGPLGQLWVDAPPDWFLEGLRAMASIEPDIRLPDAPRGKDDLMRQISDANPEPLINICFDDSGFTEHEIETFLSFVAETYRLSGGRGLKVVSGNTLLPRTAEVSK